MMVKVGTFITFTCPSRLAATAMSDYTPVYFYEFSHTWSFDGWGSFYSFCNDRACHGVDMPLVFDTAQLVYEPSQEERKLSEQVIGYFGNFAHSGDPNVGPYQPELNWELFNENVGGATKNYMNFGYLF